MFNVWFYAILSVFFVSLISFIGVFTLSIKAERLKKFLIYMLAFSAGALLGDSFIHLLPEAVEKVGEFDIYLGIYVLFGIVLFFSLEKVIHWQHCHMPITKGHAHPFAYMNLIGDGVHNLIDGLIIGASYLVSVPLGFATTLAVALHEIPQEIGDFGVLVHGGFSRSKALLLNFTSSLFAFIGVGLALLFGRYIDNLEIVFVCIAAGGFIYIASSDLIPELHKDVGIKKALAQLFFFILGIAVMASLVLLE